MSASERQARISDKCDASAEAIGCTFEHRLAFLQQTLLSYRSEVLTSTGEQGLGFEHRLAFLQQTCSPTYERCSPPLGSRQTQDAPDMVQLMTSLCSGLNLGSLNTLDSSCRAAASQALSPAQSCRGLRRRVLAASAASLCASRVRFRPTSLPILSRICAVEAADLQRFYFFGSNASTANCRHAGRHACSERALQPGVAPLPLARRTWASSASSISS